MKALIAVILLGTVLSVRSAPDSAIGAAGLRARHAELAWQLAHSPFGRALVLQSHEASRRLQGDVYAVLDHPFTAVAAALVEPGHWCEILILHLNTKQCVHKDEGSSKRIEVRVGRKQEQPAQTASLLDFAWLTPSARPDYLLVLMQAADGPYDTRDCELVAEALPLDPGHTFLHMSYSFAYGGASSFAMRVYLATIGRDKVGFTQVGPVQPGKEPEYVGGLRGMTERNTMRYYLAIDAYLDSLPMPAAQQAERRFASWFDATERFARQLHEVDRDEYLRMKRNEYRRQIARR